MDWLLKPAMKRFMYKGAKMVNILLCLLLGLVTGIFSGLIGIGGAIIIIPALVLLFGLSQHMAQGTTLALMVPPIGLLAAWTYYQKGFVDLKIAGFICIGFFIGGLLGAKFAIAIPEQILKKVFGIVLLAASLRMIFFK
jgi:uncharacterized membrane protein YfcA